MQVIAHKVGREANLTSTGKNVKKPKEQYREETNVKHQKKTNEIKTFTIYNLLFLLHFKKPKKKRKYDQKEVYTRRKHTLHTY